MAVLSDWHEDALRHKYDPLPEDGPRHKKKAKKRHVRSDHRHEYEDIAIDSHTYIYRSGVGRIHVYETGSRCKVCGRLCNVKFRELYEPPVGMPLYEVRDFLELAMMRELPESRRKERT